MSTFSVDTKGLQNEIDRMNKLSSTVGGMIQDCISVKRSLDWDVMGEQQLEKKLSSLSNELEVLQKSIKKHADCLIKVIDEYNKAQASAQKDITGLEDSIIVYDGQVLGFTDYGGIEDPLKYVNDRYDEGWTEIANPNSSISGMKNFTQNSLESGANNCTLASITRVMKYYSERGYSNIPTDINKIYEKVRQIGEKHGYDPKKTGLARDLFVYTPFEIDEMTKETWEAFGYTNATPDNKYGVFVDQLDVIKDNINNGDPVLLSIPGGDDYSGHTVTVLGYKEFQKEGEDSRFLIEVYDGWSQNVRYVDWDVLKDGMKNLRFDENFSSDLASIFNPNSCVTVFGKP